MTASAHPGGYTMITAVVGGDRKAIANKAQKASEKPEEWETMTYNFTIHEVLPSLNEYTAANRTHYHKGAQMKKNAEEEVILSIKRDLPNVKKIKKPVRVHFLWIEPSKRRDLDNIAFAKKFILDGMVSAGLIEDDSQAYVKGFTDRFSTDNKYPRIEVEVEEL